ncbi:hypothetical protein HN51_001778 [Arachis hypogaea]|uniref:uncharacterized protein n=1 Tax=Arachis hypogaea TaxID=3818 RepID=UPI0034E66D59|nr:U-box domain-containing protein [Arachis hypogaea]
MADEDHTPTEAKVYYSKSIWWSKTPKRSDSNNNGVNGFCFGDVKDYYGYNSQEIVTPEISESFEGIRVLNNNGRYGANNNEIFMAAAACGDEENGEYDRYSMVSLSAEIVEIVEDGKSITNNKNRGDDDLHVAVGKDDLDLVQWVLDHVVSPGARIFLVHVSPPITMIPTPVGKFDRSQLTPQQVRFYVNQVNNKRKELLQKYVQLINEAKITAETLLLESNDTGKAILDLISILNISNIIIGMKKLPYTRKRRSNKLSRGEFVKKNAPVSCEVTLVCHGEEFVATPYMDRFASKGQVPVPMAVSQSKGHSRNYYFPCASLFSGCMKLVDK